MTEQAGQTGRVPAVTAEFRGDVCVLRCSPDGPGLAPDLRHGLDRCRSHGVTQVVLDVDPGLRLGPAEVEVLTGDATKARQLLGWTPQRTFRTLVQEMVASDLAAEGLTP